MHANFKFIIVILLASLTTIINAQILSTGHSAKKVVAYSTQDTLFFYADLNSAALTANPPIGGTNVTYVWEQYQSVGNWLPKLSGTNPTLIDLENKRGYRVTVNDNGTPVGTYMCWVFQPEIESIDIDIVKNKCDTIEFEAEVQGDPLSYQNPANGDDHTIDYEYSYNWDTQPAYSNKKEIIGGNVIFDAPFEDVTYSVEVSAFQDASIGTAFYNSKEKDIDLKGIGGEVAFDIVNKGNPNEISTDKKYEGLTKFTGSLGIELELDTARVKGNNLSYRIDFNSTLDEGAELTSMTDGILTKTINNVGKWDMIVIIENNFECEEQMTLGPIEVDESKIEAPNVFTPNGDGTNDVFMAVYTSIKEFKMVIFNRWGRKVFQTTNLGEGWDGKIGGSKAAEGVYFYVITAKDFNGKSYKLQDNLHLFR